MKQINTVESKTGGKFCVQLLQFSLFSKCQMNLVIKNEIIYCRNFIINRTKVFKLLLKNVKELVVLVSFLWFIT